MTIRLPGAAQVPSVAETTLDELKHAVRALRALHPRSALADLADARIAALEELRRKNGEA
ncbi:hypothetical protein [Microvirga thermotolerans]|uniref:Uncharacterized protein n=1 Tax=Microvirga thermotolerans TaxID=2651334 RepID=A0A5P9JWL6_9HYPH|nr:hypothetical protein [Microvirga thermotolerans]QFU15595.1 hypothetical protein GDR74_04855 [Microvirga thermotolerans]